MPATRMLPAALGFPAPEALLQEVVRRWAPDSSLYRFSELLPMANWPFPIVEWEEKGVISGLTHAHSLDSDPLLVAMPTRKHWVERTMYWKESMRLVESDFLNIRASASYNSLAGEELVMDVMQTLNTRLDARLELLRCQTLMGQVTVNDNGVLRTITYTLGATPTASIAWSDPSSNPVQDIQTWTLLMRGKSVGRPSIWMNLNTAQSLTQNEIVRDLVKQSSNVLQISRDNITGLVSALAGGVGSINVYDEGYLDDAGTYTPFIPDNKVLFVGQPPRGQKMGAFYTTPSLHNGGPMNPKPGRFLVTEDKSTGKNPYWEATNGVYGVPALFFPECLLLATVG